MTTEALMQEIQSHYLCLKEAEARARYAYEHYLYDLKETYAQRLREIETAIQQQMASAYRWVTAPWDDPVWDAYEPLPDAAIPSAVRVGRLVPAEDLGDLPALAPMIGQGHLFLAGDDPEAAQHVLQALVLRLVVSFPPGTLRLRLADPVGLGTNLSAFLRLPETLRGDKVYARPDEIGQQLEALTRHVENVIQTRLLNLYPTIEAYNEQAGEIAVPYYVLALADFPASFDDRMAERLLHMARNGPRAGVYIVASLNDAFQLPHNFNLDALTSLGTTLRLTTHDRLAWDDPEFGKYPIAPDAMPSAEQVNRWLEAVGRVAQQVPISLDFSRIAIPEPEHWTGNVTDELSVPIGISSTGEVHRLSLGQGVVHHGLIGGITQSGKTNLLHVLITQLALRYPPEELELYLVDFKEGVEFADYLTFALPHARVVALESEREFGLSVLRHMQDQMEARGRIFKQTGIGRLAEFRRQTGRTLPRIALILDEFQVLFIEDDRLAHEAGRLLEDLARRGAAFGIHLLLASQSPSGGPAYGRRIYDQMALRIAFQCRAADAQAILGEGNEAASQLERSGEAIYNDDRGLKEHNTFVRVALLPAQERRQYLEAVQALADERRYQPPTPTVSFEGRAPARLEANPELRALLDQPDWLSRAPVARVWLGEPIEIKPPTAAPLERYMRSNLLVIGGDEAQGYGLLVAALLSLAAQRTPADARFVVVDFVRPKSPFGGLFARLSIPHPLEVAGPRQANTLLAQLVELVAQRLEGESPVEPDVYFLIAGLHRWRELRPPDPYGQTEAGKQLTRLAEEGPEVGVHLIAWADGFVTLERAFKRGGIGAFDLRVALRLPEADSNNLLGSPIAARLEDNRALFRHEDWELGRVEKFKPYVVPEADVLEGLIERVRTKSAPQGENDGGNR